MRPQPSQLQCSLLFHPRVSLLSRLQAALPLAQALFLERTLKDGYLIWRNNFNSNLNYTVSENEYLSLGLCISGRPSGIGAGNPAFLRD